jgi:hypothetical protein
LSTAPTRSIASLSIPVLNLIHSTAKGAGSAPTCSIDQEARALAHVLIRTHMAHGKGDGERPRPFRVDLGEYFLEEGARRGSWTFGRGSEALLTGLTAEEAFAIVIRLTRHDWR